MRDRRGLVSLEYAMLAAAVATALVAAMGVVEQHMTQPFDRMESAAIGAGSTIRFNPF
jgi:Flp pilus assembly pilin Flp